MKNTTRLLIKVGGSYISRKEYRKRVRYAHKRVQRLGVTQAWIAEQIGRSRGHVSHVLNGLSDGPATLLLIEKLIGHIEAEAGV